ncbi:uncharacterized protein LOC118765694 [Octopus sinensis]|uniref:Uncharacterized protein LOC118765694 n=1 Tax=Octopus sinensis TaxID=2607531 RepID=A0A7E6FAI9_9MOLL|nr:uncharacterized protein LOC118765694 [Octopus sinensis]
MPPHHLNLKLVMLLRNLSKAQRFREHCVEASLVTGSNRGRTVLIPRIKLSPSDANIPFTLNRLQFPLRLAYSMTINKAQGQTFEKVGIHLPNRYFLIANYMSPSQEHEL